MDRSRRVLVWPLIGFCGLAFIVVIALLAIFQTVFVPDLLSPLQHSAPHEVLVRVERGIAKIIMSLSAWIFALLIVNGFLIRYVWTKEQRG